MIRKRRLAIRQIFFWLRGNGSSIEDLNPITVRILNKCQALHSTVVWFLHKLNTEFLEPFASSVDVGDLKLYFLQMRFCNFLCNFYVVDSYQHTNVSESAWIRISIVISRTFFQFSSPVVS